MNIGMIRSYIEGMNTVGGTPHSFLAEAKREVLSLYENRYVSKKQLHELLKAIGKLERWHSPSEDYRSKSITDIWLGSACDRHAPSNEVWKEYIQTKSIATFTHPDTGEYVEAQKVMWGTDGDRMHIQWEAERKEGYKHCSTDRYFTVEEFEDCFPASPNLLMNLPAGFDIETEDTVLSTGNLDLVGTDFIWRNDNNRKNYRFIENEINETTYLAVVNDKWLRDALSGFDEDYIITYTAYDKRTYKDILLIDGIIRIDGFHTIKGTRHKRTAIIKTVDSGIEISEETIYKVMGVWNDTFTNY